MCTCCDASPRLYEAFQASGNWEFVCYACARKYPWSYLCEIETGIVLINNSWDIYWES